MDELSVQPETITALSTGLSSEGGPLLFLTIACVGIYFFLTKHIIPRDAERSKELKQIFDEQIKNIIASSSEERANYIKTIDKFGTAIDKIVVEMEESQNIYKESLSLLNDKITNVEVSVQKIGKTVLKLDKDIKTLKTNNGETDDE